MREIKFRAWDGEEKKMINLMPTHPGDSISLVMGPQGELVIKSVGGDLDSFSPRTLVIMQYTGLKDKNGKEIYEGDVVKHLYGRLEKVVYVQEMASFQMKVSEYVSDQEYGDYDEVEVVGNIHENPELLNK